MNAYSVILSYQMTEISHVSAPLFPVKNGYSGKPEEGFDFRSRGRGTQYRNNKKNTVLLVKVKK